jgi:hypothetical protein
MTGPSPSAPQGQERESSNALIWSALSAGFAIGMFIYSGRVEPEKTTFYVIASAIGALMAAVNGYGAWTAYQKTKK